MAIVIENSSLRFSISPSTNTFSVTSRQRNTPEILDARFSLRYLRGLTNHLIEDNLLTSVSQLQRVTSSHGDLSVQTVQFGPNKHGLLINLTFAASQEHPFLLLRLKVHNNGTKPVDIQKIELMRVGFVPVQRAEFRNMRARFPRGSLKFKMRDGLPVFFTNGWGTWNDTGAYVFLDRLRRIRLGPFSAPMRVNPGTPNPGAAGHFSSDMFAVIGDTYHRGGILIGFLSQKNHFGSIEAIINPSTPALSLMAQGDKTRLPPGQSMATDWACLQALHLDQPDPLSPYLEAVAREHGLDNQQRLDPPAGWCSWYHYYQDISAEKIQANLQKIQEHSEELPLNLIQIDDGWQSQVGDWQCFSKGFPDGVAEIASEITAAGFTPGLWLSPFIAFHQSKIYKKHPEWILRNKLRLPVNACFNWNRFVRALDISNPEALAYAVNSVRRASENWGFKYLKLDFLYAGALYGQRTDRTRTRAQILRHALEEIRAAVGPDVTLLACGCPLGSAIGVFDAVRINADVAPHWRPRIFDIENRFLEEWDLPSIRNAIKNVLTRAPLHNRWWLNDPDCMLVRADSDLTLAEVQSLATVIAVSGGSILFSDELTKLSPDRFELARKMLPPTGIRPYVLDWIDQRVPTRVQLDLENPAGKWHLCAMFNWEDKPREIMLNLREFLIDPNENYWISEFWTGRVDSVLDGKLNLGLVEPHGCRLFAIRPMNTGQAQYLGSDLHFSQGAELSDWRMAAAGLTLKLTKSGRTKGHILLALPAAPKNTQADELVPGVYRVPVDFKGSMMLRIAF